MDRSRMAGQDHPPRVLRLQAWKGGRRGSCKTAAGVRSLAENGWSATREGNKLFLDYDLWTGPAPLRPYDGLPHKRWWRTFKEYGNGIVGDMCVHINIAMDLGRPLSYDPRKRVVTGDREATRRLANPYRGPWKRPAGITRERIGGRAGPGHAHGANYGRGAGVTRR